MDYEVTLTVRTDADAATVERLILTTACLAGQVVSARVRGRPVDLERYTKLQAGPGVRAAQQLVAAGILPDYVVQAEQAAEAAPLSDSGG